MRNKIKASIIIVYLISSLFFFDMAHSLRNYKPVSEKDNILSIISKRSEEIMKRHLEVFEELNRNMNPENHHEIGMRYHNLQKEFIREYAKLGLEIQKSNALLEESNKNKENIEKLFTHLEELGRKDEKIMMEYQKSAQKVKEAEKSKAEAEKISKVTNEINSTSFVQVEKKTETEKKSKRINFKDLGKTAVEQLTKLSMEVYKGLIPPEFCWKKGGDVGVIPTDCPKGMFRSVALCYDYCPSNYEFVLGVCWEKCPRGSKDGGAMCIGGGVFKFKHSYISRSLTNFSSEVPCPEGRYKGWALCYKDCRNIGMANCGIGACSISSEACTSSIIQMAFEVFQGITQAIGFVASFGASAALVGGLKSTLKNMGKGVIKGTLKATKSFFLKLGKKATFSRMKALIKEKAIEIVTEKVNEAVIEAFSSKMVEAMVEKQVTIDANSFNVDYFISKVDVLGIKDSIDNCKNAGESSEKAAACATSVLTSISNIDPTGLSSIAAAFAKPACDIPLQISEAQRKSNEEQAKYEEEMRKLTTPYCWKIFTDFDFKGESTEICGHTQKSNVVILNKFRNRVRSIITGQGTFVGAFNRDFDARNKDGNFDMIILNANTQYPNLKTQFGDAWDKKIVDFLLDVNQCYLLYELPEFKGKKDLICSSRDVRIIAGKVQSYSKVSDEPYLITAYDKKEGKGNSIPLNELSNADLSKIGWSNRIQFAKITRSAQRDCILVCTDCEYAGTCTQTCQGYFSYNGLNNKISSVKAGLNLKAPILIDHDGVNSKFLVLKKGEEINCLKGHASGMDDLTSHVILNGERCLIFYSQPNYQGDSKIICDNGNLPSQLDKKVNSIKKIHTDDIILNLYEEPNNGGDFIEIKDSVPNMSELKWADKARSLKFFGREAFK